MGDKVVYCSFCGKSSNEAGKMVESNDRLDKRNLVRICLDCAQMAVEILERMKSDGDEQ